MRQANSGFVPQGEEVHTERWKADKQKLIDKYNEYGYRDAAHHERQRVERRRQARQH